MYFFSKETFGKYVILKSTISIWKWSFKMYGVFKITQFSNSSSRVKLIPVYPYNKYMTDNIVYIEDLSARLCDITLYNDPQKIPIFGKRKEFEAVTFSKKLNNQYFIDNRLTGIDIYTKTILAEIGILNYKQEIKK